jgi:hypothetical protein
MEQQGVRSRCLESQRPAHVTTERSRVVNSGDTLIALITEMVLWSGPSLLVKREAHDVELVAQ